MSNRTRLTDATLRNLKPPASGQTEVWDAVMPGFGVRVAAKGAKSFVLLYRFNGMSRRWTLGRYPALSLADARRKADAALTDVEAGRDPQAKDEPALTYKGALDTFAAIYCRPNLKPKTAAETYRNLSQSFGSRLHSKPLNKISRADVLEVIDAKLANGRPSAARHIYVNARHFFSWCVERGYLTQSPMEGLKAPVKPTSRSTTLSPTQLAQVYSEAERIGYPYGHIVRLLILTAQRRGEVAEMRWDEIDAEAALWILPPERTKNSRRHELPLSPEALAVIQSAPRDSSAFVFPARGNDLAAFSGWSKHKARLDEAAGFADWTLHDLRRTAATLMAANGTAPHVIERILNHVSGAFAGVAGVYNRHSYRDEMREALIAWEQHVHVLCSATV